MKITRLVVKVELLEQLLLLVCPLLQALLLGVSLETHQLVLGRQPLDRNQPLDLVELVFEVACVLYNKY